MSSAGFPPASCGLQTPHSDFLDRNEATAIDAVARAWKASFPSVPFDLDIAWSDIGVDSLKALEFALRLERSLGVKVGFDAMGPQSTAADLVHLLLKEADLDPAIEGRARVFLIPGLGGDEPKLAAFRKVFEKEVAFQTLALPDIETPVVLSGDIGATARTLSSQLISLQPDDDIFLAGYSFGSLVAHETARILELNGRKVSFLALLDGQLAPTDLKESREVNYLLPRNAFAHATQIMRSFLKWKRRFRTALEAQEGPQQLADRIIFYLLSRLNFLETSRRFLLAASSRRDWVWITDRRRWLIMRIRSWAAFRWHPALCEAPTLLVTSNDSASVASVESWRRVCSCLQVISVPSDHETLFEPEPMAVIKVAFLKGLGSANFDDQGAS